jgi:alpha-1,2-mannosyltransferase
LDVVLCYVTIRLERVEERPADADCPAAPLPPAPPAQFLGLTFHAWPIAKARLALLGTAYLAVAAFFLFSFTRHGISFGRYQIDLNVYRIGGRAWLNGTSLYGALPKTSSGIALPFSYPPIAAVLLSPLALPPMTATGTLLALATMALTALVLRVFLRFVAEPAAGSVPGTSDTRWRTVGWLLPVALLLEPVRNTLTYGQVNVVLMALVTADCLTPSPRWPRGALVGLAAAVKLTPAGFVLFFLVKRDYRAAVTALVSFAAVTGAGFLLDWHDSVRYWTSLVFDVGRPGSALYAANQSIQGVLARAGLNPHAAAGLAVWAVLSALVSLLTWVGMRRALAGSSVVLALCLNAVAALLISPVSWSHHWVWAAPAVLTLAVLGWRHRQVAVLFVAAVLLAIFALAPQWLLPHAGNRELHWSDWQQVLGDSYVLVGVSVLLLAGLAPRAVMQVRGWRSPLVLLSRAMAFPGDYGDECGGSRERTGGGLLRRARRVIGGNGDGRVRAAPERRADRGLPGHQEQRQF